MLMRRNVAACIGSNEQGEYCSAALQRSDRKEPRYKWPTLLYFTLQYGCNAVHEWHMFQRSLYTSADAALTVSMKNKKDQQSVALS